jgi:hypothetical protein
MVAVGDRRYLLQQGDVIDVSDIRKPEVVAKGAFQGGASEVAYNKQLKKWILMTTAAPPQTTATEFGKYDGLETLKPYRENKAFRGIRTWDVTNPEKIVKISEWNSGPTGSGIHGDGCFYDGGKYAYLCGSEDDTFTGMLNCVVPISDHLIIVDLSDPANVKHVSSWWVPGQRNTEIEELKKWHWIAKYSANLPNKVMTLEETIEAYKKSGILKAFPALDRTPYTYLHGPVIAPKRVEDGGTLAYGSWGSFGMLIHDVSNPAKPRLVGQFDPGEAYDGGGAINFHTIWCGTLERGFVVSNPESMNPDCNETFPPVWVIDVRDPAHPVGIAQLPRPKAPEGAPYTDFCFARGRFAAHLPPNLKAPGRVNPNFHVLSYFNAGARCYDLTEPTAPKEVAFFVPPHAGTLSPECTDAPWTLEGEAHKKCLDESNTYNRPTDSVFVEWDRRLIYANTTSGIYVLSSPALGKPVLEPMPVREWSLPGLNVVEG